MNKNIRQVYLCLHQTCFFYKTGRYNFFFNLNKFAQIHYGKNEYDLTYLNRIDICSKIKRRINLIFETP